MQDISASNESDRICVLEAELKQARLELMLKKSQVSYYEKLLEELLLSNSWRITAPLRIGGSALRAAGRTASMVRYAPKLLKSIPERGLKSTITRVRHRMRSPKQKASVDTGFILTPELRVLQESTEWKQLHTFSVLVPMYNTKRQFAQELIESLLAQTYPCWELCLADASSEGQEQLEEFCRSYATADERIKYQKLEHNGGISVNTNESLKMSTGDFFVLLDHDDVLHPSALYEAMLAIERHDADFIYSDEANFSESPVHAWYPPHFKPDFSPDTLRSYNYICHLMIFSRALQEKVGVFRSECDGSQDYDMALRLSEAAESIVHIPKVLYYWRKHTESFSQDGQQLNKCIASAKRALYDHLERIGLEGEVNDASSLTNYRISYEIAGQPLVSIIIPNKDHIKDLDRCILSIIKLTTYQNYEILVVENNSAEKQTFEYYKTMVRAQLVTYEGLFNYSAINNFAAKQAKGSVLLFLNNDTKIITPNWIQELLMFAQREDVGAVGARLLYKDNTIQHAGVIVGIGGLADHAFRGFQRDELGFFNRLQLAQNMTAVTGACMMIKADAFWKVDGFNEDLAVAYNDIDLCLKLRRAGSVNVCTPFAELYHYESKTRGAEKSFEKRTRFAQEASRLCAEWEEIFATGDPYYNPNLTLERTDFTLATED